MQHRDDTQQTVVSTALAAALLQATQSGQAIDASAWPGPLSAADVRAVHLERARWWGEASRAPQFWKSGGPSRSQPLGHAPLPPQGVHGTGADLRGTPFLIRGVEAEIALRIGSDVDASAAATLDEDSAAALVDAIAVSVEVVDSRWQQQLQAPDALKAADLLCHGALLLGDWQDAGAYRAHDWAAQRCTVQVGQQPVLSRQGSHALQDPMWLLPQWLRYATQYFGVVQAGTVVTTGSWCGLLMAEAGAKVYVEFDGIGSVSVAL